MFRAMCNLLVDWGRQVVESVLEGTREVLAVLSSTGVGDAVAKAGFLSGAALRLTARQQRLLAAIVRRPTASCRLVRRARIILGLAAGQLPNQLSKQLGIVRQTVYKWRNRWVAQADRIQEVEAQEANDKRLSTFLEQVLVDAYRCGKRARLTAEQIVKIVALACERPKACGRPITRWTSKELANEAVKRGIIEKISRASVSRLLQEARIKPHLSRYWLNACPGDEAQFEAEVRRVCAIYRHAAQLHQQGIHVVCTDEKTGIQALQSILLKGLNRGG